MEKFKIIKQGESRTATLVEVEGERMIVEGVGCFVFVDPENTPQGIVDGYNVSHLETGARISSDLSKQLAINTAATRIKKYPEAFEAGRKTVIALGFTLPINI